MKHLRGIPELGVDGIVRILNLADHMVEVNRRPVPKVPALVGRTVVSLFFEDSTRTRISFETAAKRLSADTMTFSVSTSSVNKGESLRDTIETVGAMGVAAFVVRHKTSGVPWQVSQWTDASVINAGDGWHQHPPRRCWTVTPFVPSWVDRPRSTAWPDFESPSSGTFDTVAWPEATSRRSRPSGPVSWWSPRAPCCLRKCTRGRWR
jgi:hypothetical protein